MQDATNAVQNAANAAYSKVPEGTADTVKSYVGAAQTKAAEVAPPALGGSTVGLLPASFRDRAVGRSC